MTVVKILFLLLVLFALIFLFFFLKDYYKTRKENKLESSGTFWGFSLSGFIVNFFDTLGIGSFAPTTAIFRQFKMVPDKLIPGTLNTTMCLPVIVEAMIFIKAVQVDTLTLVSMLIAAVLGAIIGAGMVSRMNEKKIQFVMAIALLIVAIIMLAENLNFTPSGGEAHGLSGIKLAVAVVANFILGSLMTVGVGLYAPCMALVYALGLNPLVAFPIMMGSCAYLLPASSIRFIKAKTYHRRATIIMSVTGILGVFVAAYFVKSLPLKILKWLVFVVVIYTSIKLFMSAKKDVTTL